MTIKLIIPDGHFPDGTARPWKEVQLLGVGFKQRYVTVQEVGKGIETKKIAPSYVPIIIWSE